MADKEIDALTAGTALVGTEVFHGKQGGNSRKFTATQMNAAVGTSFPGSPATGSRFYRTDRNIEYFYDGTRWLSTTLYIAHGLAFSNIAADTSAFFALPYLGTYSIYLERMDVTTYRGAAGEWDAVLQRADASNTLTTIATIDGSGNATTTWVAQSANINAVVDASAKVLQILHDEISGTSALFGTSTLSYRLVG